MFIFQRHVAREYVFKWWFSCESFVQSFAPIWGATKVCFVHNVSLNGTDGDNRTVRWLKLIAITVFRIYLLSVTLTTDSWDLIFISSSPLVERGLGFLLKMPFLYLLFIQWIMEYKKEQVVRVFSDMECFDAEIIKFNCSRNYQLFHLMASVWVVVLNTVPSVILLLMRGYQFVVNNFSVCGYISFSWNGGLCYFTLFILLLHAILIRVDAINLVLKNLSAVIMEKKGNTHDTIRLIRKVRLLHDKLCDVATNCSACFGVPVVFVMIHSLTCQLLVMYAFIRVHTYRYGDIELSDTIYYLVGSSLYALLPTFSIMLAGELRKSSITTWKRVHELINKASSTEVEDELQWLSEQMSHRIPTIDLQWFDVDWPIYVKACSELATYLIIMIQFKSKL
uniref:Gustatory receptor n=1 Tax=Anopheles albimanus TaxID=7167 RepID=A0A182FZN7_ANOAL